MWSSKRSVINFRDRDRDQQGANTSEGLVGVLRDEADESGMHISNPKKTDVRFGGRSEPWCEARTRGERGGGRGGGRECRVTTVYYHLEFRA